MKVSLSRLLVITPAVALILIGVASVAFTWGSSSGTVHAPQSSPAATGRVGPRVGGGVPSPVAGTVTGKTTSTILVATTAGRTITLNVSSATRYSARGVVSATLDNIAVGARITAQGTFNADGSFDATQVQSGGNGQAGGGRGFGRGREGGIGQPTPVPSAAASGPSI